MCPTSRLIATPLIQDDSILEYIAREDADRAVKELDGKDLRGQSVRVALQEDVRALLVPGRPNLISGLSVARTIIVATTVA